MHGKLSTDTLLLLKIGIFIGEHPMRENDVPNFNAVGYATGKTCVYEQFWVMMRYQ